MGSESTRYKTDKTDRQESDQKKPRGSKTVHSEKDNSTKDGFKPNKH